MDLGLLVSSDEEMMVPIGTSSYSASSVSTHAHHIDQLQQVEQLQQQYHQQYSYEQRNDADTTATPAANDTVVLNDDDEADEDEAMPTQQQNDSGRDDDVTANGKDDRNDIDDDDDEAMVDDDDEAMVDDDGFECTQVLDDDDDADADAEDTDVDDDAGDESAPTDVPATPDIDASTPLTAPSSSSSQELKTPTAAAVKPVSSPHRAAITSPKKLQPTPIKTPPIKTPKPQYSPVKAPKPQYSPVKAPKPQPTPMKVSAAKTTTTAATTAVTAAVTSDATSDTVDDTSALGRFSSVLDAVWSLLEAAGWQVAESRASLFVSMPDTQFFNFRPNVNVFDSRDKACWKFIATAAAAPDDLENSEKSDPDAAKVWQLLWDVAQTHFGWYTMANGTETWYVKPDTRFEQFEPNVTIFQTKKRAVLKCLEVEKVEIELGDSVDGFQVIRFGPKVVPAPSKKTMKDAAAESAAASKHRRELAMTTPSPTYKHKDKSKTSSSLTGSAAVVPAGPSTSATKSKAKVTPPKSVSSASMSSSTKKKLVTPSSSSSTKKKLSGSSSTSATNKLTKSTTKKPKKVSATPSPTSGPTIFIPEFKCTFGLVYKRLQLLGWSHRPGKFEYDYFAPTVTPATAQLGRTYFQSAADFEEFLKDSGLWDEIENDLRAEHADDVAQLKAEALQNHERKLKRQVLAKQKQRTTLTTAKLAASTSGQAAKSHTYRVSSFAGTKNGVATTESLLTISTASTPTGGKTSAATPSSATPRRPASSMTSSSSSMTSSSTSNFAKELSDFKVSMGKVVKRLLARGWTYRPGRFEYDYFKPGVTLKTATLNEDYFQSEAELETHLRVSGLWDEITAELLNDHIVRMTQSEQQERKRKETIPQSTQSHSPKKMARVDSEVTVGSSTLLAAAAALDSGAAPLASSNVDKTDVPKPTMTTTSAAVAAARSAAVAAPPVPTIAAADVEELTNDIWANSHHFEFERR